MPQFTHPAFRPKPSAPTTPHTDTPEHKALNGHKPNLEGYDWSDDYPTQEKVIVPSPFPSALLNAPGLVGQINQFINKTALMPQPILALGASIAATGALMGRKVRGYKNIRTNFYVIGIAPSGAGKNHSRSVIKKLLYTTGLNKLELGAPASSAGLVNSLFSNNEHRGLILWDELGLMLKQFTGRAAGNHEKDIMRALTELFTDAGSVYMAKSYANHDGKNPPKSLIQPCLSIYGTSVPARFYEALTAGEAVDGFLGRWLIFESMDYSIADETQEESEMEFTQSLLDICKFWKDQPFNADNVGGNLADVSIVDPRLIPYSAAAKKHISDFSAETRKKSIELEQIRDNTASIWSRAAEHAHRLALVGHEGDQIELNVAEWAVKLAQYCSTYMAQVIHENVSSSELEAQTKRILSYIKGKRTWVTRADITKQFQGIQNRIRKEIIEALIERKEIEQVVEEGSPGRSPIKYKSL